jgi:uncharacterized membrane protein
MPAPNAVLLLLTGVLSLWALARLVAARLASGRPPAAALARMLAAATVGLLLTLVAALSTAPMYWLAAAVAAFATAAAIAVRLQFGTAFDGPAYAIPSLAHRAPGTPGALSAAAAVAGAGSAFAIATLAFRLRLLGPSDPALVSLAAYLGLLAECRLERSASGSRTRLALTAAVAAALAAIVAAALVVFLP